MHSKTTGSARVRPRERQTSAGCARLSRKRRVRGRARVILCVTCTALPAGGMAGCGANLSDVAAQTGAAAATTIFDLVITDLVNAVADAFEEEPAAPAEGAAGNGADGGDGEAEDESFEDLTGEVAAGESIFTSSGCGACHCADASGGCALNAPAITGVSAEALSERLRGDAAHAGGKFDLNNQGIVDLEAYLSSL